MQNWLAFIAASAILVAIPGPSVFLILSYALSGGRRSALPLALGVTMGDFTAMTLSMLGIGALLATSAFWFTVLKMAGTAYLVYLGIKLLRSGGTDAAPAVSDSASATKMFGHAWLVTALNPKSITFFVAFLPQFLDPAADFLGQMMLFEATYLIIAFINAITYSLVAVRLRTLMNSKSAVTRFNRIGGCMMIGAGIATATLGARQ